MALFVVNPNRHDPYKQFKFRVKWNNQIIAGVSKVSALRRTTEVIQHREGGDPSTSRKSPSRTEFESITLTRGVTHDTEFESWANKVWQPGHDVSLADFRRDIVIELINEAGQVVMAYKVFRCWPSEYVALSDLDGNASCIALNISCCRTRDGSAMLRLLNQRSRPIKQVTYSTIRHVGFSSTAKQHGSVRFPRTRRTGGRKFP